jgi:outer membrane protein
MKRILFCCIFTAALLATSALAQTGTAANPAPATGVPAPPAATSAPSKIGVIDIQAAILATNEGRRDFETLQKKFEPRQSELQKLNQEVEELKKQLQTQGDKLNDEARGGLVKNIESKQKTLQRQAEDAQGEFQQQRDEIAGRILQKLGPVLDKYAKANAFAVILDASQPWPQGQVVWVAPPVDVTREIVENYNAQSGVPAPAATPSAPSATRPSGTPSAAPGGARPAGTTPAKPAPAPSKPPGK